MEELLLKSKPYFCFNFVGKRFACFLTSSFIDDCLIYNIGRFYHYWNFFSIIIIDYDINRWFFPDESKSLIFLNQLPSTVGHVNKQFCEPLLSLVIPPLSMFLYLFCCGAHTLCALFILLWHEGQQQLNWRVLEIDNSVYHFCHVMNLASRIFSI